VLSEDLICNTIVWLMAKLVNFMAACDARSTAGMGISWAGVPQSTILDHWQNLRNPFHVWQGGLPTTFDASAQTAPSRAAGTLFDVDCECLFTEVRYSTAMCASAMQMYHMSQILLVNKPHGSTQGGSTLFARLNSYQPVVAACQKHSREIVGISLACSDDAVRIHSVQPLFTAGQYLSDSRERCVVLDLLRGIESELGLSSNYRVEQLEKQWLSEEQESAVVRT
jgi:hypothetical protein